MGGGIGPGERHRRQHQAPAGQPIAGLGDGPGRASQWAGKIGIAPSETDFEPIITSVERSFGHARALRWLEALSKNATGHTYADNETLTAAVNNGQVAIGVINHYYWYRLRYEVGSARMRSAFTYFSPHDPGYVVDVSGAAVLKVQPAPGRGP